MKQLLTARLRRRYNPDEAEYILGLARVFAQASRVLCLK